MGATALTSQLKGKKHQEISKFFCTNPIASLLKKPNETENKSQDDMPQTSKEQVSIDNLVVSNATNKTEIRWVLNMVCSKYLKNFSSNVIRLFAAMFPDGEIAKNFQCGYTRQVTSQAMVLLPTSIRCYKRSLLRHIK